MSFIETYLFCALGIIISILLPFLGSIVRESFRTQPATRGRVESLLSRAWKLTKTPIVLVLFSLCVGLVIVAFAKDSLTDWRAAFLAGYAWDSTLQKFRGGNVPEQGNDQLPKA